MHIPTIKLVKIPIQNDILLKSKFLKSNIIAAAVIGVASKKEYLAALSLSIPKALATVIVIPERDTPGNAAAMLWEVPIAIECFKFISSYFIFDFDFLSTMYKTIPIIISVILTFCELMTV